MTINNKCIKFQLKKLGVMPPEQALPVKCNRIYQIIWANNGDAISRQYAGTAALKVIYLFFDIRKRKEDSSGINVNCLIF